MACLLGVVRGGVATCDEDRDVALVDAQAPQLAFDARQLGRVGLRGGEQAVGLVDGLHADRRKGSSRTPGGVGGTTPGDRGHGHGE